MNTRAKQSTKQIFYATFVLGPLFLPRFASAQGLIDLVSTAQTLVNQLIPLAASLTLLAFFWGLAKYIFNAGNEDAQEKGKRVMIGGIIALFLIASVGGIIQFFIEALDLDADQPITPPTLNLDSIPGLDSPNLVYNGRDGIG